MLKHIPVADWAESLREFSRRNAGRRTRLAVDDLDLGARELPRDCPLVEVCLDGCAQRVNILLEVNGVAEAPLVPVIPSARSLDILTDRDGRDRALRIGHGRAQTLLLFTG